MATPICDRSFAAEILESFESLTKRPEKFLSKNNKAVPRFRMLAKSLYDFTRANETENLTVGTVPELMVDYFDDEQIWQEINLQNVARTLQLVKNLSHVLIQKDTVTFAVKCFQKDEYDLDIQETSLLLSDHDEPLSDKQCESDLDIDFIIPTKKNKLIPLNRKPVRPSIVDDKFFKLSELEDFLNIEDEKERKRQKREELGKDEEDSEQEEDINFFASVTSNEDSTDTEIDGSRKLNKTATHCMYGDFFDQSSQRDESDIDDAGKFGELTLEAVSTEDGKIEGKDEFNMAADHGNMSSKSFSKYTKENSSKMEKSAFEIRQENLKSKIEALEDSNLVEKPWQLKGEISASLRPENSLLQEHLQFEHTQRRAPQITEETTQKLEELIQQRIKDQAWDDVERKVKPKEELFEYKKRILLNQEKSKLSLAEVYEQEYIKQQQTEKTEADLPEHTEIKKIIKVLFGKLDALSNFHFTPKARVPEVKVVSNLPSVTVEEVAPTTASTASLLTPGEILTKPGEELKGKSEREKTDKLRARRFKKLKQRKKAREIIEKVIKKVEHGQSRYVKEKVLKKLVDIVEKDSARRTSKADLSSSKVVFSRLNEMQVTSGKPSKLKIKKNVGFKL